MYTATAVTSDVLRTFWVLDPFQCVLLNAGENYAVHVVIRGEAFLMEYITHHDRGAGARQGAVGRLPSDRPPQRLAPRPLRLLTVFEVRSSLITQGDQRIDSGRAPGR